MPKLLKITDATANANIPTCIDPSRVEFVDFSIESDGPNRGKPKMKIVFGSGSFVTLFSPVNIKSACAALVAASVLEAADVPPSISGAPAATPAGTVVADGSAATK